MLIRTLVTAAIVILLDQSSKIFAADLLVYGSRVPIAPSINLTLTFNTGVAFGLFADLPTGVRELVLGLATVFALGVVWYLLVTDYRTSKTGQLGIGLIVGGAFGNAIDRFLLGSVVDFVDIYYQNYHWPAFNVADSAICIGVAILLFTRPRKAPESVA